MRLSAYLSCGLVSLVCLFGFHNVTYAESTAASLPTINPAAGAEKVSVITTTGLTAKSMPPHPFMFFGQSDIASIAKRKDKDPLLEECWTRLTKLAEKPDVLDDKANANAERWNGFDWWDQLEARSFIGKITNDPTMITRAIAFLQRVVKECDPDEFYAKGGDNFHVHAAPLRSLALAWDWLYQDMTPQQRSAILPGIEYWCDSAFAHTNKQWWREASYNVGAIPVGGIGTLALTIRGDSTNPKTTLWLREATRRITQNYFPTAFKPSGICYEGPNYSIVGYKYTAAFAEALRRAGGDDLIAKSGVIRTIQYQMYQWMPQGACAPIGDNTDYGRRTFAAEYLLGTGRTRDSAGLWTWRNYANTRWLDALITYLWYPLDLKATSPADAGTPNSKYFEVTANRAGYLFSRSKWNDPDAAFFAFVTRFERCNHEHYDMNSFLFGGFGTLFASHECVFPYGDENCGVDFEHNMVIIDEGGWPRHDGASCGDNNSTEGVLTGLATSPFADYARGDAKWSYRDNTIITDNPAIRAERTVLFVKAGANPYMVAFDDSQFSDDAHDYRWQWYTPGDVNVSGTGSINDPIILAAKKGSCVMSFVTPNKPAVTTQPVESVGRRRKGNALQRIDVTQKGIRVRYLAVATLQRNVADRPVIEAQAVECENDSAGAATIRMADGSLDRLAWQSEEAYEQRGSSLASGQLQTDGLMALVRVKNGQVIGYVLGEGTYLKWGDKNLVRATSSVCVSADADGTNLSGQRQSRKGLPAIEPAEVKTYTPTARQEALPSSAANEPSHAQ